MGKPSLHPNDIDCATVRDIVRSLENHKDSNKYVMF